MVKILNPSSKKGFRGTEQYNDCSSMLKADDPSLEELDPAILSCGLPAIMYSDIQSRVVVPPRIRYSPGQLQAIRRSTISFRRPAIADDPRIAQFPIWKPASTTSNQMSRGRGCRPYVSPHSEPKDEDDKGILTKDKPLDRINAQQKLYHNGRENGFVAPRFRRNFEFSNRNQHAIVRSHGVGDNGSNGPHEAATIEDEPEWMAAGPTSRLDTIELRGFDDDISPNASLDKAPSSNNSSSDPKLSCASNISTSTSHAEKHVSFYDDLQHYEHVHSQKQQHGGSQGRDDVESVATSSASSPPARSTPTKRLGDDPNNSNDKLEVGGNQKQKSPQLPHNGINVHNFEQFMKFESFLGPDTSSNDQTASRFTKWFRRNSSAQGQQASGSTFDGHHQPQEGSLDFGSGYDIRYQLERIRQQQQKQQQQQQPTSSIPRGGFHSQQPQNCPQNDIPANGAFRRLIDMLAANYAKNDLIAQQQYLLEVLNRGQQNENLRRMLMQNPTPDSSILQQSPLQQQQQRIPSQRELQYHTQTIMQNALLRKKLQDQRKLLQNQNSQMAAAAAAAAGEPSPLVQQFVQSVCPNLQRSLSVLNQTAASIGSPSNAAVSRQQQLFQGMQQFPGMASTSRAEASLSSPMFPGGPSHAELSASLQQMLQSPPSQTSQTTQQPSGQQPKTARPQTNQGPQSGRGAQQTQPSQQQQPAQRSGRRFGKGSVTWSNVHIPRP